MKNINRMWNVSMIVISIIGVICSASRLFGFELSDPFLFGIIAAEVVTIPVWAFATIVRIKNTQVRAEA